MAFEQGGAPLLERVGAKLEAAQSFMIVVMNLAQAATVTFYELYRAGGRSLELKRPRHDAPPASREQLEQLFADAEMALESFEFFKSRNQKTIMRGIRELVHRGPTDEREVRLLRAMALEVQRYLERKGV